MIAIDTSSLIAFFEGKSGSDVELVEKALADKQAALPPVVLTEIVSQPGLPMSFLSDLSQIPLLGITDGFWRRAGTIRSQVISRGHKARVADSLIAQGCLDHKVALITRDRDFLHFEKHCGLVLL